MSKVARYFALLASVAALFSAFAPAALAQPAGGKTTGSNSNSSSKPSTTDTTRSKPASPASPRQSKRSVTAAPASIDGKWWTSGNDFGASEVVFTQSGASVTGTIQYSDGATGTVNGTMAGKRLQFTFADATGRTGSGWLELSWNNFLGGPWRNTSVRDGSWTMMRVEGKWCFGGSRNRIRTVTHNARGDLLVITEDGTRNGGRLEGPWVFMTSDDGVTIKGETDFRANRINWSTGFFWTWCGR